MNENRKLDFDFGCDVDLFNNGATCDESVEAMRDWQHFFTREDFVEYMKLDAAGEIKTVEQLREVFNAKIREALQAAPKVYGKSESVADGREAWNCSEIYTNGDTHVGRLVEVKPIEKGE